MQLRHVLPLVFTALDAGCIVAMPDAYYDPETVVRGTLELGGQSMTDEGYWKPTDEPMAIGGTFEMRNRESGFGGELGAAIAFDEADVLPMGTDAEMSMAELFGGARQTFTLLDGRLHPFVGAGVTVIDVAARVTQGSFVYDEEEDITFGLYARTGVYWNFGGTFDLGLDLRTVFGTDIELAGADGDVDFTRVSLVFGWSN
ncbi:MAG: hypothetical protein L6Q99_03440 [Planctomycetes bacterium]|nr:hypothetical protein [Planctomycetota bacterium]